MSYYEVKVFYGGPMKDHCEKFICDSIRIDIKNGLVTLNNEYSHNDLTTVINEGLVISPYHYAKISYNEIEDYIMEQKRLDKRVNNNMSER